MKSPQRSTKLAARLIRNVVPAYLAPAAILSVVSRLIPDEATGNTLSQAAYSTIAIPSALAGLAVTLFLWQHRISQAVEPKSFLRSVLTSAAVCGFLALVGSAALIITGHAATRLFADAIPSAVIGGTIAAVQMLKTTKRA
jgi:hypothetical protein